MIRTPVGQSYRGGSLHHQARDGGDRSAARRKCPTDPEVAPFGGPTEKGGDCIVVGPGGGADDAAVRRLGSEEVSEVRDGTNEGDVERFIC